MSLLDSTKIVLWFELPNLEPFLYIGIILLVFKIEGNIPEEKDWLKRIASWSDKSLCISITISIGILLGPSFLPCFKDEIMLETLVLLAGVLYLEFYLEYYQILYLGVGGNHNIFSWKI